MKLLPGLHSLFSTQIYIYIQGGKKVPFLKNFKILGDIEAGTANSLLMEQLSYYQTRRKAKIMFL